MHMLKYKIMIIILQNKKRYLLQRKKFKKCFCYDLFQLLPKIIIHKIQRDILY